MQKISFEEAIRDRSLREKFVKEIIAEIGKPKYVKEALYLEDPELVNSLKRIEQRGLLKEREIPMGTVCYDISSPRELGKKIPSIAIVVFPEAFDKKIFQTKTDFISALKHEYRHAKAFREGRVANLKIESFFDQNGEFNTRLFYIVLDLDAISWQIFDKNISQKYREMLIEEYTICYEEINRCRKGMNTRFIESLKSKFLFIEK